MNSQTSYFNYVQRDDTLSSNGINVYSFGLHPEQHQPSGTMNYSRIYNDPYQFGLDPNEHQPTGRPGFGYSRLDIPSYLALHPNESGTTKNINLQKEIKKLPIHKITKDDSEYDSCPICFTDYDLGDEINILKCKHHFCIECMDNWAKTKNTCPMCRSDFK